jgi:nitroreductase
MAGVERLDPHHRRALLAARTAPSAHNSQPWQFRLRPDGLELGWAPERELPHGDPNHAYLMIGLGAAAEAATLGLALDDHSLNVLWNLDDGARTVANLRTTTDAPSARDRELAPWLTTRATTRLPFGREGVEASVVRTLVREAEENEASLAIVTGPRQLERFADLTVEGTSRNMADPSVYREFHGWLRLGRRERTAVDGLTGSALGFGSARSALARSLLSPSAMGAWRSIGVHRMLAGTQRRLANHCGAACLLSVPSGRPGGLFAGGRVMLRVWLTATIAGLQVHPLTAAMDHPETRSRLADLFGVPADASMVVCFRLGYGPSGAPAPRRPLADLVDVAGGMRREE